MFLFFRAIFRLNFEGYIYIYICVCVCVCVYIYVCVCVCVCVYIYIYIYIYILKCRKRRDIFYITLQIVNTELLKNET